MTEPQLVRPIDAARTLDMNVQRIYNAIKRGVLRTYGPDGRYVHLEDVKDYLYMHGKYSGFKPREKKSA